MYVKKIGLDGREEFSCTGMLLEEKKNCWLQRERKRRRREEGKKSL